MSGGRPVRRRGAPAIVALALAGMSAAGAQTPSKSEGAAGVPESIAGAKKDFESLKSVRDAALFPNDAVPRVALPEFPAATPSIAVPAKPAPTAPSAAERVKSPNWLVDAMEKNARSRNPLERQTRLRDQLGPNSGRDDAEAEEQGVQEKPGQATNKETEAARMMNPLTRYLGEWMTPQDFALLKPGLPAMSERTLGSTSGVAAAAGSTNALPGNNELAFGIPSAPPVFERPKENPYLETLRPAAAVSLGGVTTTRATATPPPALSSVPAVPRLPPPQSPLPPSRIPDFVKPSVDDKYFKPLNRF